MSNLLKFDNVNVETSQLLYSSICEENKAAAEVPQKNDCREIAEEQAKIIIKNAKHYASKVRGYAQKKSEKDFEEARSAGFKEGYEAGREIVEKENQIITRELKALIKNLDEQKEKFISFNEKDIIDVAFKIAEKVIKQKLDRKDEAFMKIYKNAVKDLVAQKWVKITVSDLDLEFVTSNSDYLISIVSGAETIDINVLDGAPKGTCIVETSEKIVDASVDTQLNALYKAIVKS